MTFILKLVRINDYIFSSIAFLTNLTLLYLILTTKQKEIQLLGRVLIQTCVTDLFLAVIIILDLPVSINFLLKFIF